VSFPTLVNATASLIQRALDKTHDKLIRVDLGAELDVDSLLAALDPAVAYRIGLTSPLSGHRVRGTRSVTTDARQITRWRNESIAKRRESPLLVLGRASGRDEAGLRRCPIVITEKEILRAFGQMGVQWLIDHVQATEAPQGFFSALIEMALDGLIGLQELDTYCSHAFEPVTHAHVRPKKELWRLGLIPDDRAMDPRPGLRLSVNYDLREALVSAPSSDADERRKEKLVVASENGNPTAAAALKFATSRRPEHLKDVELVELLRILEQPSDQPGHEPRAVGGGLLEALEQPGSRDKLAAMSERLDVAADEFADSMDIGGTTYSLALERDPQEHGDSDEEDEGPRVDSPAGVLYVTRPDGSDVTDSPGYAPADLIRDAETLDQLAGTGSTCRSLAHDYLEARNAVSPLVRWGRHLLDVLIISEPHRRAAEAYRDRWRALVDFVLKLPDPAHADQLRQRLSHLDALWEYRQSDDGVEYLRARLLPIHPFVLTPHLELAQHAIANIGKPDLAEQVRWAQDRSIPAYPAVWIGAKTLLHSGGSVSAPTFAAKERVARPPLSTANGIVNLARAYVGIHPYARRGLSILLVDPPEGPGVASAIRQIRKSVVSNQVRVSTVLWNAETLPSDSVGLDADNLGRIHDLQNWITNQRSAYHFAVVFGRPRPAHVGGSHPGVTGPSRGLQNALTVSVTAPQVVGAGSQVGEQVPCVSIQPRESHDVVRLLMGLARLSDRDERFFEIRPLLQGVDVDQWASFGKLADWLAFAAPSPIGLIPPLSLPRQSLSYLGREELGSYALFVYARDLYSVRRRLTSALRSAPMAPQPAEVERQLEQLALAVPNGVLRLGRGGSNVINAQVGLIAASHLASKMG